MNKMIKGSVAGATGIALLMGGFGTYALWNQSATMGQSSITSGDLGITAGSVDWQDVSNRDAPATWDPTYTIVPGDVITRTQTFAINGHGHNLKGTIDFAEGAVTSGFSGLTVDVDVTSNNGRVTETVPGSNDFSFDSPFGNGTLTAVVTYTFPSATSDTVDQDKTATLPNSTFTISQSSRS